MVRVQSQSTGTGGWTPVICAAAIFCGTILWSSASSWPSDKAPTGPRMLVVAEEEPPVEADPDLEMLRLWLELLRQILERSSEEHRESASALIQEVVLIYEIQGLPEDLSEDQVWWSWYLDVGEVLLAAASDQLDVDKVNALQDMIDDIRAKLVGQP